MFQVTKQKTAGGPGGTQEYSELPEAPSSESAKEAIAAAVEEETASNRLAKIVSDVLTRYRSSSSSSEKEDRGSRGCWC